MFFLRKKMYEVKGPQGGISTKLTLPEGFDPKTGRCTLAVLMHGFMSSMALYPIPFLAKTLASRGIASIAFDFDAHGKSEGKFVDMTLGSEIADARAVYDYAVSLPFVEKIGLIGHSQGGVVAGILAGLLEKEGKSPAFLIQLAPAAVLKDDAIAGQCMGKKYDPVNPPEYVNVMFHKLGRKFIKEAQQFPIYEKSALYTGPVCLIHGTKDNIVPISYSEKYRQVYRNAVLHSIEGEGHMLRGSKDFIASTVLDFIGTVLA